MLRRKTMDNYIKLIRIESHQYKDNTINILFNEQNKKYFVLDLKGWLRASEYFYTLNQCYAYIESTYGLKVS